MNLDQLFSTAAAVTAAALYEIFPGCCLLGGGGTETGFFYQFSYSKSLSPESLAMVEERMRQIIREDRVIREMEMVACSAKEMFLRLGQQEAAQVLEELNPKELVSLVKIGDFCDLIEGPFCSSVRDAGAFRLMALQKFGDHEYRIEGCVAASKDELKKNLKTLSKYEKENHLVLGQEQKWWQFKDGHLLWLERGLAERKNLIERLKKQFTGVELAAALGSLIDHYAIVRVKPGRPFTVLSVVEKIVDPQKSLFEGPVQSTFQQIIYCTESDFRGCAISLLQTLEKTLNILGFHAYSRLQGQGMGEKSLEQLEQTLVAKRLDPAQWVVQDGLERPHIAVELKFNELGKKIFTLKTQIFVERILALLLEQKAIE